MLKDYDCLYFYMLSSVYFQIYVFKKITYIPSKALFNLFLFENI